MTCHNPSLLYHLLNSHEGIGKVFGIFHCRYVTAYLSQALCKGTAAQVQLVEREVDMVQRTVLVVFDNRTHHLTDIADLTASTDNNGSRRDNLLTVGILLCQ